jgi:molybdopterin-guanine dinucleotide biosynthesis protein A
MLGVVLCGGQSTRMGTDKGMMKYASGTWAQNAAYKLAALKIPVVLSVNDAQHNEYAALFDVAQLITDNIQVNVGGPLRGVLSVHQNSPGEDLFVLACDMPLMEISVMEELLNIYKDNLGCEAFLFTNDEEPEPLCAIYTSRALARINHLNNTNQLPKHSMKFMLAQLKFFSVPASEKQKHYFNNYNSHAALNGL